MDKKLEPTFFFHEKWKLTASDITGVHTSIPRVYINFLYFDTFTGVFQGSSGSSKRDTEWNPFYSCTGEVNDPAKVIAHVPVTRSSSSKSRLKYPRQTATLMRNKAFKAVKGLLANTFFRGRFTSRFLVKGESDNDNGEGAGPEFSIPPGATAASTRCRAQSPGDVASGSAAAGSRGNSLKADPADAAAEAASLSARGSATPSLSPYHTK